METYSVAMVISTWASMATWFTPIILFCFLNFMIGSIFIASKFKIIQNKQHQHGEHNSPQLARAPSLLARVKSINFSRDYPFQSETRFADPGQDYHQTESENENHGPEQHQLGEHNSLQLARVNSINSSDHDYPSESESQFTDPVQDYHQSESESEGEGENENDGPEQYQLGEQNSGQLTRAPSLLARDKSINSSDHDYPSQSQTQFTDPVQDYHQIESANENENENHGRPELDRHVIRSKSQALEATPEWRVPAKMRKSASVKVVDGRVEDKKLEVELRRPATVRERKSKASVMVEEEEGGVDEKADDFINMFKQQLKLQRMDSLLRYNEMLKRGSAT